MRQNQTDNGSEFISKVMDKWAYERGVELDFSRPGKPTDNARVESFNGRLRQECLNVSQYERQAELDAAAAKRHKGYAAIYRKTGLRGAARKRIWRSRSTAMHLR